MLTLKGEIRDPKIKLATLRSKGFIPAVFYGRKEKSTPCVFLITSSVSFPLFNFEVNPTSNLISLRKLVAIRDCSFPFSVREMLVRPV
ncbi:MAG: hypothetical protein AAB649_07755, partial [Patescibacteria group bacterium]